jgi:YD repeat-containing protein
MTPAYARWRVLAGAGLRDGMGRLLTTNVNPGANVATTTMTYDAIGQVTRVTRPDNSYFDYVYDGAKRVTSVTSNLGEKIEYVYDLMSNVTSRTVKGSTGTIVRSQTAAFDELGRTLRSIGASNQTTTYSYDKTSNLKSTTDPRGKLFSYGYDSVNRLIQELDPNGSSVNYRGGPGRLNKKSALLRRVSAGFRPRGAALG